MIEAFEKYFGEYPFKKDGFKLIEVPYSGMEHQSAVTYGNRFANGYLERDWTGVGISLKFDFIIIHESAHEWFGNAVSAADQADMWIHEGWATYLECLYVEHMFGYDDYLKYTNAYKTKIGNKEPIITQRGIARDPNQDMYFKGALFIHTLRSVVNDLSRRNGETRRRMKRSGSSCSATSTTSSSTRTPLPKRSSRSSTSSWAGPDADLRSVSSPRGLAGARADVR